MKIAKGDFKICLEEANEFITVAKWCNDSTRISSIYSSVVNVVFSCELYIKAIMIYNSQQDEFQEGHDIKILFNSLQNSDKLAIEKLYNKKCSKKLDILLTEINEAFIKWRYAFEDAMSINITECLFFAQSLEEYVNNNCI